jgi:hypothetical protein
MKIQCRTLFDITVTGVTGHYKPARMPFYDGRGQLINSMESWNLARNQQRNWETLTQLISLRTQVDIVPPLPVESHWVFEFEVATDNIFSNGIDSLATLKSDCSGVPMLINLTEQDSLGSLLLIDKNIWFTIVPINTL